MGTILWVNISVSLVLLVRLLVVVALEIVEILDPCGRKINSVAQFLRVYLHIYVWISLGSLRWINDRLLFI